MKETSQFHTVRGYQLLEQNRKLLTPAMEDYLEMIYRRSLSDEKIGISQLSELLNVAAPSATKMVQKLNKLELLNYQRYGCIELTEKGIEIGKYLLQRHEIIDRFLKNLGVTENVLLETELIEHHISAATLQKFNTFNKFAASNPGVMERYYVFAEYDIG